jgi:leader peptidase (prepilin peptidase) / N-methyltransferase
MSFIALACLITAPVLLVALSVIDLRHYLLPDKLVLPFFIAGIVFHSVTGFYYAAPLDIGLGILTGGGILYLVRLAANYHYKQDSLGLGDVKLLAAAGAWLGPHDILLAIIAGALAGIVHGLALAEIRKRAGVSVKLSTLNLPAGPGFIIGIVFAGFFKFWELFDPGKVMYVHSWIF